MDIISEESFTEQPTDKEHEIGESYVISVEQVTQEVSLSIHTTAHNLRRYLTLQMGTNSIAVVNRRIQWSRVKEKRDH